MNIITLSNKDIVNGFFDEFIENESGEIIFETVDSTEWIDGGKFHSCFIILRHIETDNFYRAEIYRYGSHYNGYDYDDFGTQNLVEVEKKIVQVERWERV